jgi:hypothetical protein
MTRYSSPPPLAEPLLLLDDEPCAPAVEPLELTPTEADSEVPLLVAPV